MKLVNEDMLLQSLRTIFFPHFEFRNSSKSRVLLVTAMARLIDQERKHAEAKCVTEVRLRFRFWKASDRPLSRGKLYSIRFPTRACLRSINNRCSFFFPGSSRVDRGTSLGEESRAISLRENVTISSSDRRHNHAEFCTLLSSHYRA